MNIGTINSNKEYYICLKNSKKPKETTTTTTTTTTTATKKCQSVANNLFLAEIQKEISALNIMKNSHLSTVLI